MEFKHLKQDFPKMPEEIKTMIENEVKKQLKTEPQTHRSKRTVRKTLALSLAAVMLCGLTVFAGAGLYRMQRQQTGEHGVSVRIESSEGTGEASFTIPDVKLEVGYLPDGMVRTEHGKYSFETFSHQKHIYKKYSFFDNKLRFFPKGNKEKLVRFWYYR